MAVERQFSQERGVRRHDQVTQIMVGSIPLQQHDIWLAGEHHGTKPDAEVVVRGVLELAPGQAPRSGRMWPDGSEVPVTIQVAPHMEEVQCRGELETFHQFQAPRHAPVFVQVRVRGEAARRLVNQLDDV